MKELSNINIRIPNKLKTYGKYTLILNSKLIKNLEYIIFRVKPIKIISLYICIYLASLGMYKYVYVYVYVYICICI